MLCSSNLEVNHLLYTPRTITPEEVRSPGAIKNWVGSVTAQSRDTDVFGVYQSLDIPLPLAIKHYNQFMGGRKDCHGMWHNALYTVIRGQWFARKSGQSRGLEIPKKRVGRPIGSKNKRRKRAK